MSELDTELADDLLRSASEIAYYLYKDRSMRRRIYHLAATTSNMHGVFFKMGGMLCTRKSTILQFIDKSKPNDLFST